MTDFSSSHTFKSALAVSAFFARSALIQSGAEAPHSKALRARKWLRARILEGS